MKAEMWGPEIHWPSVHSLQKFKKGELRQWRIAVNLLSRTRFSRACLSTPSSGSQDKVHSLSSLSSHTHTSLSLSLSLSRSLSLIHTLLSLSLIHTPPTPTITIQDMGEVQGRELNVIDVWDHSKDAMSPKLAEGSVATNTLESSQNRGLKWWVQIGLYIVFILLGQSVATLLGRLYYDKGGKSKWVATLCQIIGFPVILPLYYSLPVEKTRMDFLPRNYPLKAGLVYIFLGSFNTAVCMLYSTGLMYLPVSTFSLICASQLAFNALFSFFLNSQKFTPYIVNSLVLLTISSTLLVFNSDNSSLSNGVSKSKQNFGYVCAIANSAGYGLLLSLTQLAFKRVLKRDSFRATLDMIVYQSISASCIAIVGLFASGEWRTLKGEMDTFKLGKISYLMTLIWTALSWQLYSIGLVGLIVKISSLFSNVIATFGLPIVPVLAVIFFHDNMDGIKIVAMLLAIWGFVSYAYQQFLDHHKAQTRSPPEAT